MDLGYGPVTWTCHVCDRERPDAEISVAHRPAPGREADFPRWRCNVRYCNDNPQCVAEATAPGPWTKWFTRPGDTTQHDRDEGGQTVPSRT